MLYSGLYDIGFTVLKTLERYLSDRNAASNGIIMSGPYDENDACENIME